MGSCLLFPFLILFLIESAGGVVTTHEFTLCCTVLQAGKTLENLSVPASWTSFPTLAAEDEGDMDCAVRCSQDLKCQSFIMSGGSCYVGGETVPNTEDFVDSETLTTSFYTRSQS